MVSKRHQGRTWERLTCAAMLQGRRKHCAYRLQCSARFSGILHCEHSVPFHLCITHGSGIHCVYRYSLVFSLWQSNWQKHSRDSEVQQFSPSWQRGVESSSHHGRQEAERGQEGLPVGYALQRHPWRSTSSNRAPLLVQLPAPTVDAWDFESTSRAILSVSESAYLILP